MIRNIPPSAAVARHLLLSAVLAAAARAGLQLEFAAPPATPPAQPPVAEGYAPLLRQATPSIVSVFPAITVEEGDADRALERFFVPPGDDKKKDGAKPEGPQERTIGSGSGVIVSRDGYIVTNRHVVILPSGKSADLFKVELSDKRQLSAKLVGMDTITDLALLKVDTKDLPALPLADSDAVNTGDLVFAIGNPFRIGITATMGMVSATRRCTSDSPETLEHYIQTDAAINPGNSGGALINSAGRLIGINTAIYGNSTNAGIGFAIPTRIVKHVVENLAAHGKVPRGFFGIQGENPSPSEKAVPAGAVVSAVMPESPAAAAGLAAGDRIVAVNDTPVNDRQDLRLALAMIAPETKTTVDIVRGESELKLTMTPSRPNLNKDRANFFSEDLLPGIVMAESPEGIVIHSITGEAAGQTKLAAGMIIAAINNAAIEERADIATHLRKGMNKVVVTVGETTRTLLVRIP